MPVNYEIKSQLAKLLATEDIVVENKNVETAQFNVETRVLTLPMWKRASNDIFDMLVGHEVGHALYTPNDWSFEDRVPRQFVNVTEDARIEKLMKRRYPGLSKSFYRGYQELSKNDFFCLEGEDISKMNLADRINLYFKIGNFIDVPFNDEEEGIKNMVSESETFADAVLAAEIVYAYCKKPNVEEKVSDIDMQPQKSGQSGGKQQSSESQGSSETDSESQQSEETVSSDQQKEKSNESGEPEVSTDEIFNERTQEFNGKMDSPESGYFEMPKIDLSTIIVSNEKVHSELNSSWDQQLVPLTTVSQYDGKEVTYAADFSYADKKYQEFKKSAQREVNYLVKEFECKKSADAYARASVSKTGVLDCSKLHTYKFNEDLFKKVTVLPDGKNHGLIFILDWSGSMQNEMLDTMKQIFNLIWFCSKVNIPFDLYCFTNSYKDFNPYEVFRHKELKYSDANKFVIRDFNLLNLLTSGLKKKTLDEQMISIWRLAFSMKNWVNYSCPEGYGLSGTPLNETIACLYEIIPQFKAKHELQKVQCIILTDGEANCLPVAKIRTLENGEEKVFMGYPTAMNSYFRNRKNGHTYQLLPEYYKFTEVLLEDLKKTFTDTNFIGIRLIEGRSMRYFISKYETLDEKKVKIIKKDRFYAIKESGYTTYFAMANGSLSSETDFDVEEGASKAKIKSAFAKNLKGKALNKKVLSQFMDLVC